MNYFGPVPNLTTAYAQDSSENEYFGQAPKGADINRERWQIIQKVNTGGASNPTAWIMQFPVGPDGIGTDAPMFIWAQATTGTYTYASLGSKTM